MSRGIESFGSGGHRQAVSIPASWRRLIHPNSTSEFNSPHERIHCVGLRLIGRTGSRAKRHFSQVDTSELQPLRRFEERRGAESLMKQRLGHAGVITTILGVCLCLSPTKTYAYIDPAAGSSILQLLIASFLGVLYAAKLHWARIKSFLGKRPSSSLPTKTKN
jgi:hypothetical protein